MSSNHTPTPEGFVLVPVRKAKISRVRKALIGVAAIGAAGAITAGTFASFSATTTNSGNTFSTGKVELSNKVPSQQTCVSGYTGPGTGSPQSNLNSNDNSSCPTLVSLPSASPGDTAYGVVTIDNTGNYDGTLDYWLSNTSCTAGAGVAGGSDLCGRLKVFVQEFTDADADNVFDSGEEIASCVFPLKPSAACALNWSDTNNSVTNWITSATAGSPDAPADTSLPMAGSGHKFVVAIQFPDGGAGADNAYQNRNAAFAINWRLQEA